MRLHCSSSYMPSARAHMWWLPSGTQMWQNAIKAVLTGLSILLDYWNMLVREGRGVQEQDMNRNGMLETETESMQQNPRLSACALHTCVLVT